MARRRALLTVYTLGLFQGLALVALPAAAPILQGASGYGLSSGQYGLLFLPQVVLAIAAALALPGLAGRVGTSRMLQVGVAADAVAMGLVLASVPSAGTSVGFPLLLLATASLGAGFGTTLSCLSDYAGSFSPGRPEVAVTALNVLLGLGTALSPLLVSLFDGHGRWWYLPLLTGLGLAALLVATLVCPLAEPARPRSGGATDRRVGFGPLALYATVLVAYGVGETMFGNWGTTLLESNGTPATQAAYALAAFWAAVTAGRLLIAVTARRVSTAAVYVALPWAMAVTLAVTAYASDAGAVLLFAAGGLACSGFFPMTVGYGEKAFPSDSGRAAGRLVAAYQVGYGVAAFGAGAAQTALPLSALFLVAALVAVAMAVGAVRVVRRGAVRT